MAQTFTAQSDTLSAFQSEVIAPTVAMDEPNPHRAHLAIFNTTGSNQIIKIRKITVTPGSMFGATLNTQSVIPITAHFGGEVVAPFRVDSNNASFPATVEIKKNVFRATDATGSLAKVQRSPNAFLGVTAGYQVQWKYSSLHKWNDATTSQVQKYSLRNGEGLAIKDVNFPATNAFPIEVTCVIRLSDTGACYNVQTFTCAGAPYAFTILNNGYTAGRVEVLDLCFNTARGGTGVATTADVVPTFQVAMLNGYNPTNNGTALTPLTMDSANTLNSYIKVYKDLDIGYYYSRKGNLADNALFFRTAPITAPQTAPSFTPFKQDIYRSPSQSTDIVIREGKGMAVLLPSQGSLNSTFCIDVVFTQEVSYPATGDVRLGTEYGAGVGTLVVSGGGESSYVF
jgi:hypothetical protein